MFHGVKNRAQPAEGGLPFGSGFGFGLVDAFRVSGLGFAFRYRINWIIPHRASHQASIAA
jgi:hypothetical protein